MIEDQDEDVSWLGRNGAGILAGAFIVALVGAGGWFVLKQDASPPPVASFQQVTLVPVEPPPPPPEPEPPEKVVEEEPLEEEEPFEEFEEPPEDLPPLPDDAVDAPPGLGLDAVGEGPGDVFGLVGRPGGGRGGGGGGGGAGANPFNRYGSVIQVQVADLLKNHEKTRYANVSWTRIAIWVDGDGRISRVRLLSSTGDRELDQAIESEVLLGKRLERPPAGLPQPIQLRARFQEVRRR